jgi:hypothetical protein
MYKSLIYTLICCRENDLLRFDGYEYKRKYSHFAGEGDASRMQFHDIDIDSCGRLYGLYMPLRAATGISRRGPENLSRKTITNRFADNNTRKIKNRTPKVR